MINPFIPRVGGIMSADIAVPHHDSTVRFYSDVLCTGKNPLWRSDLMNNLGMPIIGLGAESSEYPNLPLQWMPHIQVADIAKSVKCALDLGGSEVLQGKSEDGTSLWAVLLDPNGAAFGLIPVIPINDIPQADTDSSLLSNEGTESIGCISWLDLTVSNAPAIRDFYQSVIGWTVQNTEIHTANEKFNDTNMLDSEGNSVACIRHAIGKNQGLPPVWLIHLPVGDIEESLCRVKKSEGKIIKQTTNADGIIESAVIQDPVGANFTLVHK